MNEYTHILVAVDLTEESRALATKAALLQKAYSAKLSCVHVIEPLSLTYGGDVPMDLSTIQEQIQETAKNQLQEFAMELRIDTENQHLIFGRPQTEIDSLAHQIAADLIVVGSHGRAWHRFVTGFNCKWRSARSPMRCSGCACGNLEIALYPKQYIS